MLSAQSSLLFRWTPRYLNAPTISISYLWMFTGVVWGIFLQKSIALSFVFLALMWRLLTSKQLTKVPDDLPVFLYIPFWNAPNNGCIIGELLEMTSDPCYIWNLVCTGWTEKESALYPVGPLCCKPPHQIDGPGASHTVVCWWGSQWSTQLARWQSTPAPSSSPLNTDGCIFFFPCDW